MLSKFTLAIAACIAYGATSVMALPAQSAYGLSERDFADFIELDSRMFDNSFEEFVVRQVGAPPVVETPVAPGPLAVAEPITPAVTHKLSTTGSPESAPLSHQRHGGRRRRHRHSPNHASAGSTSAKEAVVSPDSSMSTGAQDAGRSASPVAARSASDVINARDLPAHGGSTRRVPRTPSEILNDRTLDPDQRRHEMLEAKRYREALAHREALQAAGQGRR